MRHTQRTFKDLLALLTRGDRAPQDWRAVLALSGETLTIGSLADHVLAEQSSMAVPVEVRELLEDVQERARRRNDFVLDQFRELLGPLNTIGVKPIAMKGLARLLAHTDERSRLLSDMDLLVPSESRNACIEVFTDLGYEMIVGAEDESFPPVFARSRDVGTVDLHTRLKPPDLQLGYEAIAPLCHELELEEGTTLIPSTTAQLVLAILHDQLNDRDYWRGFIDVRHLVDLDRFANEGIDWKVAASFFETGTRKRAFHVQMLTTHHFLGLAVPHEYRSGTWAKLQLMRRRVQWRFPKSRAPFTLLTLALDPPRGSGRDGDAPRRQKPLQRLKERFEKYIWRAYPGKV